MFNLLASRRFKPVDIAVAMLFAGWVPSILMAVVSYGILSRTLDSKIIVDRSTLVAFYLEGQSLIEMSDEFSAPIGTIKRRLHVARKRLAKELECMQAV